LECAESLETFAKYVVTKDEHGVGEGSMRVFPSRKEKPAIWYLLDQIQNEQIIAVEKSRQLIVTWSVCFYCFWVAKFQKNRLIFIQSKKELDAANLVFNTEWPKARISFMEYHLPESLKSECSTSYGNLYFKDTASTISGIPEGGDQIRSYTASVIYCDEAAFQPEFEEAWTAAQATINGGGKIIVVSTAKSGAYMRQLLRRA
jgi:hypothetical protein